MTPDDVRAAAEQLVALVGGAGPDAAAAAAGRRHVTVCHATGGWARDADGDGK
jgi:hypothetical protein